jgi:hypothetical protein
MEDAWNPREKLVIRSEAEDLLFTAAQTQPNGRNQECNKWETPSVGRALLPAKSWQCAKNRMQAAKVDSKY